MQQLEYDKLDANQQQFYEDLFDPKEHQADVDALHILHYQFDQNEVRNELSFLPKQKQMPWVSITTVGVLHEATNQGRDVEPDINDSGEEDYDAPVIMEPVTDANWIAREYRNLKVSDYGKSKRTRKMNSRFND